MSLSPESRPQRVFAWELVSIFALAGLLVVAVVERLRAFPPSLSFASVVNWQQAFVGLMALIVIISVVRKVRSRLIWEIVFTLALFLGVWYLALLALPFGWGIGLSSTLTILALVLRTGLWHNAFVLIGSAGVAMNFAGWLSSDVLLVGLVVMTLYDTLAGPPGGPVEELASRLVQKGVVPGFILVPRFSDLFRSITELMRGNGALLGAGDVILPLSLVVRAAFSSWTSALMVLAGLCVGALVLGRGSSHPRAALVPLAAGAAIPFFILRLMGAV